MREYETGHPVDKSVMMAVAATSRMDLQKYEEEDGMAVCSFFEELMEEGRMERSYKEIAFLLATALCLCYS